MEQTFRKLQEEWEARVFQLDKVTLTDGLTPAGKTSEGRDSQDRTDRRRNRTGGTFVIAGERDKSY